MDIKGALNVTFLAVFLKSPGDGRETMSMFTWPPTLETLN